MLVSKFSTKSLYLITFCAVLGASVLSAGNTHAQSADKSLPEGISATVNGRPIPTAMIAAVEAQLKQQGEVTDRNEILEELINLEVLTQRAEAQKLDQKPDVAATLQLQYAQTMANSYLESLSTDLVVTDEAIRAEYDDQVKLLKRSEYRASHILLDTEADAVAVIDSLNKGGDFTILANEFSTGPSAAQGGDLGWFDEGTMVAEFSAALTELKKGEYTKKPVQTQFGWHVIYLVDTRTGNLPDFNSVKGGIRNLMIRNMLNQRVSALREQAKIVR